MTPLSRLGPRGRYLAALLPAAAAVSLIGSFCAVPLGALEEHFSLGQQLRATGSLNGAMLRPPGFPAFVALVLLARDGFAFVVPAASRVTDAGVVMGAQRGALLLVGLLVFRFAAREMAPAAAFGLAALFCVNPLSVVLSGALTYPMLDSLLITLGTMALVALDSGPPGSRRAAAAGALWGLVALVRPVVLVLPGLVAALPLFRQGHSWKRSVRLASGLALGMGLVVGPYMLRNLALSGRFIPVNAQAGFALWASSAARPAPGEAYVSWVRLWNEEGMRIYERVTGSSHYSIAELSADAARVDREFGRAALANIRRDPGTYAFNVANNLWRFQVDTSEWWWRRFLWENNGRATERGQAAPLPARAERAIRVADGFLVAVSLAGLASLAFGLARRDPWAAPLAAVYAALCLGNALSFMISRYTYARLPLLILSLGMLARVPSGLPGTPSATPRRVGLGLVGALLVLALWATLGLLLAMA